MKINYLSDTIVYIFIYYQLTIMKRELVWQNVNEAHLNFNNMKHYAYIMLRVVYLLDTKIH